LLIPKLANGGGSLLGRKTVPGKEVQLIGVDGGGVVCVMVCVWWLPNLVDADEAGVGELGG
jgi:hypothetical protein